MKVLIAEDDVIIGQNLFNIISQTEAIPIKIIDSLNELINEINVDSFDVAFLDVRMHGNDLGIEMAKLLVENNKPFVFITAFSDSKTLENTVALRPSGFILKPFKKEQIFKLIDRLLAEFVDNDNFLWVKSGGENVRIDISDISHIQSENVYAIIYTKDGRVVTRMKLADLESFLPVNFLRTHQSYLINCNKVEKISEAELVLYGNFSIPISRRYQNDVKEKLGLS